MPITRSSLEKPGSMHDPGNQNITRFTTLKDEKLVPVVFVPPGFYFTCEECFKRGHKVKLLTAGSFHNHNNETKGGACCPCLKAGCKPELPEPCLSIKRRKTNKKKPRTRNHGRSRKNTRRGNNRH